MNDAPRPQAGAQQSPALPPSKGMGVSEASKLLAERWRAREAEQDSASEAPRGDPEPTQRAPQDVEPSDGVDIGNEPAQDAQAAATELPEQEVTEGPDDQQYGELPDHLTVDDLARDYGLDKNELMQRFRHPVRAGDEEREVGLHELIMGYQRGREHESAMATLERERQSWEAEKTQRAQILDSAAAQLSGAVQITERMFDQEEQEIHGRYQHTDWARLRGSDPGEYSARWTEYQSALQGVASRRHMARQEMQRAQQELVQAQQARKQEAYDRGRTQLTTLIPSWSDADTLTREGAEVTDYLKSEFGASDQELAELYDPRVLRLAYDSMQLKRLRAKAEEVRNPPADPAARPGQTVSPQRARFRQKRVRQEQARDRLRQTGKQEDAARALAERWRK